MRVIGYRNGALGRIGPWGPPGHAAGSPGHAAMAPQTRREPVHRDGLIDRDTDQCLIGTGKGQRPTEPDLRHEVQTFIRL